jgi:hypothetical protein
MNQIGFHFANLLLFRALIAVRGLRLRRIFICYFSLAPAYDMLPMRWSPARSGEIVERQLEVSMRLLDAPSFKTAHAMAEDFWGRVRDSDALARRFSTIADAALSEIASVRRKMARFDETNP